jgi:hypothetical protein
MTRPISLALLFLVACSDGPQSTRGTSSSPQQLCIDMTQAYCDHGFACEDTSTSQFQMFYGSTKEECYDKLRTNFNCVIMDSNTCGDNGANYSLTKHQACVKLLDGASCSDWPQLEHDHDPPCDFCGG